MSAKIYVREFTESERRAIATGLHSKDSFVLRRSQMLLFSSEALSIDEIAAKVGYHRESVRLVIKGFNEKGVSVLEKGLKSPHNPQRTFSEENAQNLKELLRYSPREFEKASSLWTLELLAEVSFEQGLSARKVSYETIRTTLKELGVNWKRAKHWITSPDPHYAHKKNAKKP